MGALIVKILGSLAKNKAVREAAPELVKTHGVRFLKGFVKYLLKEDLTNLTKEDILNMARKQKDKQLNTGVRKYAHKFARLVNKGIDKVENTVRLYAENRSLRIMDQMVADATGHSKRRAYPDGGGGFKYRYITSKQRSREYQMVQRMAGNTLEGFLFPMTRNQAFFGGFFRGLVGETLSRMITRILEVIVMGPRGVANAPRIRIFYRAATKEIRYLQSIGETRDAAKLYKAVQSAFKLANKPLPGQSDGLIAVSIYGNVSGRTVAALGFDFLIVGDEERSQRIEEWRASVVPFAKERSRRMVTKTVHVKAYRAKDGRMVAAHDRKVKVAA